MYLLGIDVGTSSVKVSVVDSASCKCVASATYPEKEMEIVSVLPGYAEQDPELWWSNVQAGILKCNALGLYDPKDIGAIGIAYQMHGLVLIDKNQHVLRPSIIWCDSRAVEIGERAFVSLGSEYCLAALLNSPGNFTASKLAWVKENEPEIYEKLFKFMLPGDFIAMKLTGEVSSSPAALSEGMFWDFKSNSVSTELMDYFGFDHSLVPELSPVFSVHGELKSDVAARLGLKSGIQISYKAGDQPNNALSLGGLKPGEVAATAGTSGVIYGVGNTLAFDPLSRVNTFASVDYSAENRHTGTLLCINGCGSSYRWARNVLAPELSYKKMNELSQKAKAGSSGLIVLPFGNGAERIMGNRSTGLQILGAEVNVHRRSDVLRAVQEGIAFSFRYGLDIMRGMGIFPSVIRAGQANLFQSGVFVRAFVEATSVPVELHETDGATGAAIGAGVGARVFSLDEAFQGKETKITVEPHGADGYEEHYQRWKCALEHALKAQP